MKNILLYSLLFLISNIGSSQIPLSQGYSKEVTEHRLIRYITSQVKIPGSQLCVGDLEIFTADISGDLSAAYYSFRDTSYFVLAFYNNKWNEYGTVYQKYSFKMLDIDTAMGFLLFAESMYNGYASTLGQQILQKNQYVISEKAGLRIFIDESKKLFIYWPEKDLMANWKISNLKRAKRRLENAVE